MCIFRQGFVENEPFIPVHVENYTEREANNCLDLYEHKLLLQNEAGKIFEKIDTSLSIIMK